MLCSNYLKKLSVFDLDIFTQFYESIVSLLASQQIVLFFDWNMNIISCFLSKWIFLSDIYSTEIKFARKKTYSSWESDNWNVAMKIWRRQSCVWKNFESKKKIYLTTLISFKKNRSKKRTWYSFMILNWTHDTI